MAIRVGSLTVGEEPREVGGTARALLVGRLSTGTGWRQWDLAFRAAFLGAGSAREERWKRVTALEAVLAEKLRVEG